MWAVKETSKEKFFQESCFSQQRRCYRKLCCLFKLINKWSPRYLFELVPSPNTSYFAQNSENIPQLCAKHGFLKNFFFPSTNEEWKNLDPETRKFKNISILKSNTAKFIRPKLNNIYYCHNFKGIRLENMLRLTLSYLCEPKLKHNFQDCHNPLCFCVNDIESFTHYLIHCPAYTY